MQQFLNGQNSVQTTVQSVLKSYSSEQQKMSSEALAPRKIAAAVHNKEYRSVNIVVFGNPGTPQRNTEDFCSEQNRTEEIWFAKANQAEHSKFKHCL